MAKKLLSIAVCCASLTGLSAKAAQSQNDTALLKQVLQRTQEMEQEMQSLRHEVVYLKSQLKAQKKAGKNQALPPAKTSAAQMTYATQTRAPRADVLPPPHAYQQYPNAVLPGHEPAPPASPPFGKPIHTDPHDLAANILSTAWFLGGTPVFTSPYLGQHSEFDGSDLIVQAPSVNLDVRLLKQMQGMENYMMENGIPQPEHPLIELSGKVEGLASFSGTSENSRVADLNLASAELDVFAQVNPWVFGYIAMSYDPTGPSVVRTNPENSRLFINKGFVTIGNLNRSPAYASIGQLFVPFGQYGSFMLSTPNTLVLGRTKDQALVLGLHPAYGFYGAGYIFRGDTDPVESDRSTEGVSLGYAAEHDKFSMDIRGGFISNLANSVGMQLTGAPADIQFGGFGSIRPNVQVVAAGRSINPEAVQFAVPGLSLYSKLSYGNLVSLTEYVSALDTFSPLDLTFNGVCAKPSAFQTELGYIFNIHEMPANVAIGYSFTKDALALLLPHQSYMAVFNISLWRDTIESIEYRYDNNYAATDIASGAGTVPFGPLDSHGSSILAQIGVYF